MGRNGTKAPVFPEMVRVINENVGKVLSANTVLLGKGLGRNAVTSYLYRFVKLGYLQPIDNGLVRNVSTSYKVLRKIADNYTSVTFKEELDALNASVLK